jgi:serine/threonine-protein kinase HipA
MQKVSLSLNVQGELFVVGTAISSEQHKASVFQLSDSGFFLGQATKEQLDYAGSNVQSFVFKDAMPDAWGGALVKYRLKQKGITKPSFADTLMMIGESGAWRFEPSAQYEANASEIINWRETIIQTHKIVKGMAIGEAFPWLAGSDNLGGARPKFYVDFDNNDQPTYGKRPNEREWIVKLPSPVDRDDIGIAEYQYNQLARECGIAVTDFKLIEGRYFATKRFDLTPKGNLYTRTLAGLNSLSHADSMNNSYESVIRNSMRLFGQNNAEDVLSLALFNRIMGNCDDHAKNISFLCDEKINWSLAPAYDLTPNVGLGSQAMSLNGTTSPNISDFFDAAESFGIDDGFIDRVLDRLKHLDGLSVQDIEQIKSNIGEMGIALPKIYSSPSFM